MRILLDECVDESLRRLFEGHDCQSSRYAGLTGLSNGQLLAAAEKAQFDVLITVDRNLPHQQSLRGRSISVVLLHGRTTNYEDLACLIPNVLIALRSLGTGQVVRVDR